MQLLYTLNKRPVNIYRPLVCGFKASVFQLDAVHARFVIVKRRDVFGKRQRQGFFCAFVVKGFIAHFDVNIAVVVHKRQIIGLADDAHAG